MNSLRHPNFGDAEFTPRLRRRGWNLLIEPRARVFCQPNTIPPRVRRMSAREKFSALFGDLRNGHNLRRRFNVCWDGAPGRTQAVAAFCIFFIRTAMGRNLEGQWAQLQEEAPLSATFADAVVED